MKNFIYYLCLLFIISCKNNYEEEFISRYSNYDFSNYQGKEIYVRGFSSRNFPIIFLENVQNNNFIRLTINYNKQSKSIIDVEESYPKDSLKKNSKVNVNNQLKKLTTDFIDMNIYYLKVDSLGNIYVKPSAEEYSPVIGKFISEEYRKKIFVKSISLENGWYKEIND
ncbi:hypothetical protein A1704_05165 [Chryseobacterium cucumeris]|uniref:DUF3997 domain-containing protein n=1 Tax=Chryseobacterium indologenes TaxID=253 RepID=A0A411DMV5_CHRID|nr:hypothetical protein [Chryseobacterium cucumeris]KYH08057.1 hypothetical protein A1704_05165 [Chryseobacterium cucumeris]QBA21713.1 hypothetical protein EU348_11095 [Chryseobacterium indologenes]